jgi:hypothetical protein
MTRWTDAEIKYLKEQYGKISTKDIASTLNRSIRSIQRQAQKLNLKKFKLDLLDHFWTRVAISDQELNNSPCLEWIGNINNKGYGRVTLGRKYSNYAHRWAYEFFVETIPEGLEIDHLCRNHACVNPLHLEPVTHEVNVMRGTSPSAIHLRRMDSADSAL